VLHYNKKKEKRKDWRENHQLNQERFYTILCFLGGGQKIPGKQRKGKESAMGKTGASIWEVCCTWLLKTYPTK